MKIGIFTDVHANLPALSACFEKFSEEGCDEVYHLGDLIGIGPFPKECLELVGKQDNVKLIMGNHDAWYANGLGDPYPPYMNEEEVAHHLWTHNEIGAEYRDLVANWKFELNVKYSEELQIHFLHYGLNERKTWFYPFIHDPNIESLDQMFDGIEASHIFYGHQHVASDFQGNARYVNLGSAGCYTEAVARVGIMSLENGKVRLAKYAIPYDDRDLFTAFEDRNVPARDFIIKTFITRS